MTTKITDHTAAAVARLPSQWADKPNTVAFLEALVGGFQSLSDAIWQLLTERGIDDAYGVGLDRIGAKVGQPRDGASDDDYRRLLRARILTSRSKGTPADLIAIGRLIVNDPAATFVIGENGGGDLKLTVGGVVVASGTAEILARFLREAVKPGVRIIVSVDTGGGAFTFTGPLTEGVRGFAARARLQINTANLATLVGSRQAGTAGNSQTLALVADAGASAGGTLTDGQDAVFTFKPGTTTGAQFEAALATSSWLYVASPSFVATLQVGDAFAATALSGAGGGGKLRGAR